MFFFLQGPLPTSAVVDVDTVTITYDNGTANIEVRTQDNFEVNLIVFVLPIAETMYPFEMRLC